MAKFQEYFENREIETPETSEALRDIHIAVDNILQQTPRTNGYGINKINFEKINEHHDQDGVQINLEVVGEATAKNKEHVQGLLQKLIEASKPMLLQKKIFLEIYYHKLNVTEKINMTEYYDETPNGLKKIMYFNVVGAALLLMVH